uniref:Uncharacterized protein n=1 Tax=Anopheles coluzzii TaxID=1518534 RepID=A0A8W7PSH0_ANOCL
LPSETTANDQLFGSLAMMMMMMMMMMHQSSRNRHGPYALHAKQQQQQQQHPRLPEARKRFVSRVVHHGLAGGQELILQSFAGRFCRVRCVVGVRWFASLVR